jgi:hypothetical protein
MAHIHIHIYSLNISVAYSLGYSPVVRGAFPHMLIYEIIIKVARSNLTNVYQVPTE